MKVFMVVSALWSIMTLAAAAIGWITLTWQEALAILAVLVVSITLAEILQRLEDIKNALAEGSKAEGLRPEGRTGPQSATLSVASSSIGEIGKDRLGGHWHKPYVPPFSEGRPQGPARYAWWCPYVLDNNLRQQPEFLAKDCPDRDPRSTR